MRTQITSRDWEAISAYLDNQLKPIERSRLESRLENELELRQALQDLRKTRHLLRNSPRFRAPRNFVLTPSMAGLRKDVRSSTGAFPILRMASILASFFFILVTVGSFAIRYFQPAPSVVMRSEVENAAPVGMGGGGGGSGQAPALAPLPTQAALTAQQEGEAETPLVKALAVTPVAGEIVTPTPGAIEALTVPEESASADASPAVEETLQKLQTTPALVQPANHSIWSFLGIIQIFLALLAAVTGLGALYLSRNALH
jgi:anti-sigma factor RsiW